jgi:hypothetical protein
MVLVHVFSYLVQRPERIHEGHTRSDKAVWCFTDPHPDISICTGAVANCVFSQRITVFFFLLLPSSGVLGSRNTTFRKLDLFPSSDEGEEKTPTQLCPLERANLNHFKIYRYVHLTVIDVSLSSLLKILRSVLITSRCVGHVPVRISLEYARFSSERPKALQI